MVSIVTSPSTPPSSQSIRELHLPARPAFGLIDGSRYDHWSSAVETALAPRAARRLRRICEEHEATAVHAVAHSPALWPAFQTAQRLRLPYLLSVHDDLRYVLGNAPLRRIALRRLGRAWRGADERFVISDPLGEEYCRRYGAAPYAIVTDGLREGDFITPRTVDEDSDVRAYFAGLFHMGYRPNLRAFLAAMEIVSATRRGADVSMTCRCGALPELPATGTPVVVLPFGTEADVRADLANANLLYLPLMLEDRYRDMIAYSLSTKLVTYLASGAPIVYHGPAAGAAYELLARHDAAILATSSDPPEIARTILDGVRRADVLVANARRLARRRFMLDDQRARFWSGVRLPREAPAHESRSAGARLHPARTR